MTIQAYIKDWKTWVDVREWTPNAIKVDVPAHERFNSDGSIKDYSPVFKNKDTYELRIVL